MDSQSNANVQESNGGVALNAGPASLTVMKDAKFSFKKPDPLTGQRRTPITLQLPVMTVAGLSAFLQPEDEKVAEKNINFLLGLLEDVVKENARQQVADDDKPVTKQEELDIGKLDLTYIANLPAAERRAGGIPKETWDAFEAAYIAVMPGVTNKKEELVQNAAFILKKRLVPAKTNKTALKTLEDQLNVFWNAINDEQKEEFADIYAFLNDKLDTYLKQDEAALIVNNL